MEPNWPPYKRGKLALDTAYGKLSTFEKKTQVPGLLHGYVYLNEVRTAARISKHLH